MIQENKGGEHRVQLPVVHVHMDFKYTETKSEHGLEPPNIRRRVSRGLIVPLDSQPHHNRANEIRKRVNLIYTAVRGPSESNTSSTAGWVVASLYRTCSLLLPNSRGSTEDTSSLPEGFSRGSIHPMSGMNLVYQKACLIWICLCLIIWFLKN